MLGQVLGGYLIDTISWRAAFLVNVPLALVVLLIVFRYVPESHAEDARSLDLPGALLVTVGLGGVVYGLIGASDQSLDPFEVVAIVVGAVALVGFVVVERHAREPLIPLHLFGSRNFSGANLMTFLLYAGFGGALFLVPIFLIQVHGYSATAATSALVPFAVVTFLMGRWAGGLVTRYGEKLPLMVGPAFAAAGFILFAVPGVGGSYWTTFFPAVVVLGFGMSLVFAPLSIAILNAVEEEHSGLGSGVNRAVQRTAKVLGLAVLAFLVLATFDNSLDASVNGLDLTPAQEAALRAEKADLGASHIMEKGKRGGDRCRDRPGRGPCLPQCVPFRDVRLGGDGGHERDRGGPCDSREREERQRARKVRSSRRWVGDNSDGQVSENRASAERHRLICAADRLPASLTARVLRR